ncbi:sel1 repeat family protein [Massilia sp. Dwa41.01b]|uniref:tetratricopeptide repeat protein n=1 Tax=unclassified Massilia TaxID=2609279 RepID=UPI001603B1EC|nr:MULTISPECIES: sel1 repeat family protein [unclassified Massilia]QNA89880.1 sel1 repeat family protein [Massilia sp. Dwa41.01b]QNB00768.1 sel1 repeat family protein [Massilia sp. Se16.2.3]
MKRLLITLGLGLMLAGAAHGGELEDAKSLFEQKKYPEALKLYTKLANAGNVEAQQNLGQMYWYGEAGAVDEAKAQAWFRKAAAKGNKVAVESLAIMEQRVTRRADIDYWLKDYDGADLRSGKFACPAPRIPPISKQTEEIERVTNAINKWQDCYNAFVQNLNAHSPLADKIPADVAKLMNAAEMARAKTRLAALQENMSEEAKVGSKMVLADIAVWRTATEAYIAEHNAIVNKAPKDGAGR